MKRRDTVPSNQKYIEGKYLPSQFWGWLILILFSGGLIGWAVWIHLIIPDVERHWDFGQSEFTPAESIYSTVELPGEMAPVQQLPTLPEAKPLQPPPGKEKIKEDKP